MNEYPSGTLLVIYRIGLLLLAAYLAFLGLYYYLWNENGLEREIVFLTVANVIWLVVAAILKGLKRGCPLRRKIAAVWLCMYMLSALWVNNTMYHAFASSAGWYAIALLLIWLNTFLLSYFDDMSARFREIQAFVLGITTWILLYLIIYLGPVYPFALMAAFVFGISLTVFAPLALTWYNWRTIRYMLWQNSRYRWAFLLGAGISLMIVTCFCIYFGVVQHNIERRYEQLVKSAAVEDPEAALARELSGGFMEKRVLKAGIVYTTPLFHPTQSLFGSDESEDLDMSKKEIHDPLIMIAALLCGESSISQGDKEIIVRLMSGEKLPPRPKFIPPVIVDTTEGHTTWHLPSAHMADD
ncbi:hypothetical protein HHL17_13485 [Chitinophaga sp. G-6-1-13]|uniref:Uncharacterized protein n=1 Tax=Chitinophaga fulva TaxID=2728842 RepID=A0A848GMM4_9BACT|nr:hypothetical protein [Chitinophaga fulva]NML38212.1 hypothetical protein [Chitinophaga fulva]